MLALLDEFSELTVVRGESALYEFIEREAPDLFARVRAMVDARRWEPVGGTFIQFDNNLPTTETTPRQFVEGQAYFKNRFARGVTTAWFSDTFGHSAGLLEIFAARGIRQFAHCRPFQATMPLREPAYWGWATAACAFCPIGRRSTGIVMNGTACASVSTLTCARWRKVRCEPSRCSMDWATTAVVPSAACCASYGSGQCGIRTLK